MGGHLGRAHDVHAGLPRVERVFRRRNERRTRRHLQLVLPRLRAHADTLGPACGSHRHAARRHPGLCAVRPRDRHHGRRAQPVHALLGKRARRCGQRHVLRHRLHDHQHTHPRTAQEPRHRNRQQRHGGGQRAGHRICELAREHGPHQLADARGNHRRPRTRHGRRVREEPSKGARSRRQDVRHSRGQDVYRPPCRRVRALLCHLVPVLPDKHLAA